MEKYRVLQKFVLAMFIFLTALTFSSCSHSGKEYKPAFEDSSIEPIPYEDEEAYDEEENGEGRQSKKSISGFFKMPFEDSSPEAKQACTDERLDESGGGPVAPEIQEKLDAASALCEKAQELWKEDRVEEAVSNLDQAYNQVMDIEDSENPAVLDQMEELRVLISKRLLEIYSSKKTTVQGTHKEIPLTINHHVEAEIRSFQSGERSFFVNAYKRSGLYRDMIVKALKEAGLPEELSWLPLIESGYKVRALSPARALGMWQFIPSTGYKFGLTRDKWIDERMDPEKSTVAAINYMKEMHEMFGDWMTVLAGYNCGEWRVLNVIKQQKINYLDNFWDLYERLPRETARYVPRFLATLAVIKDPKKYGFDELGEPYDSIEYEAVQLNRKVRLQDIAVSSGVNLGNLELLNPELRFQVTPEDGYSLKVPKEKGQTVLASLDTITESETSYSSQEERETPEAGPVKKQASTAASVKKSYEKKSVAPKYSSYHKVKTGETIYSVARDYNTNVQSIMAVNKIGRTNKIYVGQKLKLPGSAKAPKKSYASSSKGSKSKMTNYKVRSGDTLWSVAKRHGTTAQAIKQLNKIKGNCLMKGQVIRIPRSKG
ncbi:MAG TPA: LysM peptidoglycan-binding domain-containing protein [Thermodesulfovibrionia bacterium]|nr:LysM peptidoglycan-binding domain-containing protein [Thermodesulfovibrionia bacterium]